METISGMTIEGGTITNANGGSICNAGALTVEDSTVSGNTTLSEAGCSAANGGGIYNAGALTVEDSTVSGNTAETGTEYDGAGDNGGGIYDNGAMTVEDSTISGNGAFLGGGIYNGGRYLMVEDSRQTTPRGHARRQLACCPSSRAGTRQRARSHPLVSGRL